MYYMQGCAEHAHNSLQILKLKESLCTFLPHLVNIETEAESVKSLAQGHKVLMAELVLELHHKM